MNRKVAKPWKPQTDKNRICGSSSTPTAGITPLEILRGAALAVAEYGHTILLTGNEADIRRVAAENAVPLDGMEIVDASDVITMDDEPKKHPQGAQGLLHGGGPPPAGGGKGDAFVSAGSTGAPLSWGRPSSSNGSRGYPVRPWRRWCPRTKGLSCSSIRAPTWNAVPRCCCSSPTWAASI